jgi:hypothetical protein
VKANAQANLLVLDTLDQADRLTEAASAFRKASGRAPRSLEEVARAGFTRVPILDMEGHPFDYDPETGEVSVSTRSRLWRPKP